MRKKIALIGLVIFVIGVVLIASFFVTGFSLPKAVKTVSEVSAGEWDSGLIQATPNGTLAVIATSSSNYGLIPASDLSQVTSSNLASLAIKPLSSTSIESHLALTYMNLSGLYYFVVYSSSTPAITVTFISNTYLGAAHGLLILAGGLLSLIGIIVGVVGLVMRKKVTS